MKNENHIRIKIPLQYITLILVLVWGWGCNNKEKAYNQRLIKNKVSEETNKPEEYAVEAPPFSEGIYPCNDCHSEIVPNPDKRELVDMHDDISAMFNHDRKNRWCLDCHDMNNRDSLRLASGKLIAFEESYKLCGQCHGEKLRDWKVGVHGKRTGEWNGKKEYLLCVHCHNPHAPKFKELTPEPPPIRQEKIQQPLLN
ncbi:MAG TPA: cytochrome c3 family protein [Sunxiuqinia sp.]|nr:cytochrome c3 family protein [Sunxiuqinia sp.]